MQELKNWLGLRVKVYPIAEEANRIKEMIESTGKTASVKIFGFPHWCICWRNANDRHAVAKACAGSDAANALRCFVRAEGVASALPESLKVIPGMATVGTISAYLTLVKGKIILDKTKT